MTFQLVLVLAVLVGIVVTLSTDKLGSDVLALVVIVVLLLGGVLTPEEAFAGFSKEVIVILAALFVVTGALRETGAIDMISQRLMKHARGTSTQMLFIFMTIVSGVSVFMSNTTVTAMFIPTAEGIARRLRLNPSRLYIPLAYASILGGTISVIGTSTNLAVSGYLSKAQHHPIGFFETAPVGVVLVAVGIVYVLVLGRFLLPNRDEENAEAETRTYHTEIIVMSSSLLMGQRVTESHLVDLGITVTRIVRGDQILDSHPNVCFEENDIVVIEAAAETLLKVRAFRGIQLRAEAEKKNAGPHGSDQHEAEALVAPHSRLLGRSLKEANFEMRAGVAVLGLFREGEALPGMVEEVALEVGDLLLLEGSSRRLSLLRKDWGLSVLGEVGHGLIDTGKAPLVVAIFVAAIIVSSLRLVPTSVAFLSAALCCVLTGCLRLGRAYEFITWKLLILIACMSSYGVAMEKTGAAQFLANGIVHVLQPLGAIGVLSGLVFVTIILAPYLSSSAAALVILPISISVAHTMGAHDRPFEIAVMLAPSISFIAPLEPSFLLIYGPGKYRYSDFVRIGLGATFLLALTLIILVQWIWPLHG